MSRDPRKAVCDELAQRLAEPDGMELAAWMRLSQAFTATDSRNNVAEPAETARAIAQKYMGGQPERIGIWKPREDGDEVVYRRDDMALTADWWAPAKTLAPKTSLLPLRVVLLGESTAAGWFHAPDLTPARVLESQLGKMRGPRSFEVVDLSMVNLQPSAMTDLFGASLQLTPDIVVVFAGNNWPLRFGSGPGAPDGDAWALAFRESGIQGLVRLSDERSRRSAERTLDTLALVADASGVPVIVVVPESNLADWQRDRPVAWLPSDGSAAWHRLHRQAHILLSTSDFASLAALAEEMIELDGATCASSFRLLGDALSGLGKQRAALDAYQKALDLRSWDNIPSTPSATSAVRDVLLERCDRHGFVCVDLPHAFSEYLDSTVPDRRLFLDYCHLTAQGMRVAMASVTSEVLRLSDPEDVGDAHWRTILEGTPVAEPSASSGGLAKLMSALYNAHYGSGYDVYSGRATQGNAGVVSHWLDEAVKVWPGARDAMRAFVLTRANPQAALGLSLPQQRFYELLNRLEQQAAVNVGCDPELVEAIEKLLDETTPKTSHGSVDLVHPAYQWSIADRYQDERSTKRPACLFYRALWSVSHFCLVSDGVHGFLLELTTRLPSPNGKRRGKVALLVNGNVSGDAEAGPRWGRFRFRIPADQLRAGFNQVTLEWPELAPEGDAALTQIGQHLELGLAAEIHPVFGEIFSFRAERAEPA